MSRQKTVLEHLAGRRLTAVEIGDILGVTEKTARKRLSDGLNASDVITICRAAGVNPVEALVELKFVTLAEAMNFVDSDGQLLATADEESLFLELVDRSLTTSQLADLLAARSRREELKLNLSTGMTRAEVERNLITAQVTGLIDELKVDEPAAVVELESKRKPSDFDATNIDIDDLDAVAHEPEEDPADPDDADDHDWIP